MEKIKNLNSLIEILQEKEKVYIQTHNFPDPDAIASAFGLQELLKHFKINSEICYKGRIEKINILNMIDYLNIPIKIIDEIDYMSSEDYIVIVDAQKGNSNTEDFIGDEVAVIDHHQLSSNPNIYRYSDIRTFGSCSTIIYTYYEQLGIEMSTEVATGLFYGLKVDTNDLTRMVTMEDVKAFSKLYSKCDMNIVKKLTLNSLTMDDLNLYTRAIDKLVIFDNIAFADLGENCNESLLGAIGDFLLDVNEINFVVSYTYTERGVKFSLRCEMPDVDASKVAAAALKDIGNGGGHREMAGGFVPHKNADIILNDRNNIYKRFRNAIESMI